MGNVLFSLFTVDQTMTSEVESCGPESSFAYGQFKMDSTLVTEFDMACNKSREVVLIFH